MKVRPKQQQLLREAYKLWPDLSTGFICVALERAARNLDLNVDAGYCQKMKQEVSKEIEGYYSVYEYLEATVSNFEASRPSVTKRHPKVLAKRMEIWRLLFTKYEIPLEELK